ncbi:MAG: hypothetical protein ABIU05_14675 [Nitrospirales bacterium]
MAKSFEEYLRENPKLGFSLYTHNQITILTRVGQEIEYLLDEAVEGTTITHIKFERAYGLFWLWVLGAFGVIRTMCTEKDRFLPDTQKALKKSKARLIQIRAPMAKQKYAGRNEEIRGELSVSGFDSDTKCFCLNVEGEEYWARALIKEFNQLVSSIGTDDIVAKGRGH